MYLSLRWLIPAAVIVLVAGLVISHWLTFPPAPTAITAAEFGPVIVTPVRLDDAWSMTVVGDLMLDRHVRTTLQRRGQDYPFAAIREYLEGDAVIANLEGPFTNRHSVATDTRLIFTFDPAMAPKLKELGFTHLSLANNHTLNFGQAGLEQTRQTIAASGLSAFGDPSNRPGFVEKHPVGKKTLALIGYHGLPGGLDSVLDEVRLASEQRQFVLVMPHWGQEYALTPSQRQRQDARALIDAGADLVIGAHPHVVQPFEIYQNKLIAFSLGNFIFDQYFSENTLQGLMLQLTIRATRLEITVRPIRTTNQQIELLAGAARDTLLKRIARDSVVPDDLRDAIQRGYFVITQ